MLDEALRGLARSADPNLLVGFENADDAAVYQLTPELALVQTADFFTPIVDDPFVFGQIAAANALSDIYAMGGRPVTALSLVAFPANAGGQLLAAILAGGQSKLDEAGCALAGGHSVRDEELKFGFAVSGIIHPAKIWRNGGARVGDVLVLTKPLGTGVIGTAVKRQRAQPEHERAAAENMARLNRLAAETLGALHPHAVTDVTGFGLLGHAREMARASRDGTGPAPELQLRAGALPLLPGAEDYAL
ncbi:MAG: selenide, water dikinase SelD, partial [Terriglobales bacterium]